MRCPHCRKKAFEERPKNLMFEIAGVGYVLDGKAQFCLGCGETVVADEERLAAQLSLAKFLADRAVYHPQVFRFMRRAIGYKACEIARLFGIEPETLSRWENDQRSIPVWAHALLGHLVAEHVAGRGDESVSRIQKLHANATAKERTGGVRVKHQPMNGLQANVA